MIIRKLPFPRTQKLDGRVELDRFTFETIDSTNRWAKSNLGKFRPQHLTIVSTEHQTGGYGRHGRSWISPLSRNLTFSLCFRHSGRTDSLTEVAAVSVAQALEGLGLHPRLKWPNDVLLSQKKVCGILCEAKEGWVILGVGLNVNMTADELKQVEKPATSLLMETTQPQEIKQIEELIEGALAANVVTYLRQGFEPFYVPYTQRLIHKLGDPIQFDDGRHKWQGTFHQINRDGSLSLIVDDPKPRSFYSGDIA